jgi:hypothetical protein
MKEEQRLQLLVGLKAAIGKHVRHLIVSLHVWQLGNLILHK